MSNHNNGYDFEPTNNSTFSLNLADNNVLEDFSGNYVDVDGGNPSMPEPESRMDVLGALDGFANQVHVARSRGISDFYQWNARNNSSAAQNNATTNGLRSAPDMTSDNTGLPSFNYGGRFNANGPFLFNRGHAGSDSMQRIPAQGVHRRIAPSNTQNTSTIKNQLARMNTQMEARVTHIADMQIQMADMHTRMTGVQTQLDGLRTQMAGLAGVAALPNAPNPAAQPMAAAQGSANTVIKNASATAGDTDDQGNAEAEGSRGTVSSPMAAYASLTLSKHLFCSSQRLGLRIYQAKEEKIVQFPLWLNRDYRLPALGRRRQC